MIKFPLTVFSLLLCMLIHGQATPGEVRIAIAKSITDFFLPGVSLLSLVHSGLGARRKFDLSFFLPGVGIPFERVIAIESKLSILI